VVEQIVADLCRDEPGRELTLVVDATVRALIEVWAEDPTPREVIRAHELHVDGREEDAQNRALAPLPRLGARRALARSVERRMRRVHRPGGQLLEGFLAALTYGRLRTDSRWPESGRFR
jgi:hypothetical protein